jgi:hypothetical protein
MTVSSDHDIELGARFQSPVYAAIKNSTIIDYQAGLI